MSKRACAQAVYMTNVFFYLVRRVQQQTLSKRSWFNGDIKRETKMMNEREQELSPTPLFPSYVLTFFFHEISGVDLPLGNKRKQKKKKRSAYTRPVYFVNYSVHKKRIKLRSPSHFLPRSHHQFLVFGRKQNWERDKNIVLSGLCKIADDATPPLTDIWLYLSLLISNDFGIHLEIPRTAFDDDVDYAIESEMFESENQFGRILDPTGI
jgi:hypothetical protein